MEWITQPESWVSLATLTLLEIVLGIDNIVFISILAGKLPKEQQKKAWNVGLGLALITRILLLLSITWVMSLKQELFSLGNHPLTGRDLILLGGGLFLVYKAVKEIHEKLEGEAHGTGNAKANSFASVITQILILDIVFSLDSVITAVGMADHVQVMIVAVVLAIGFMLVFAQKLSEFVNQHPTVKMLALAFLVLIGVNLIAEGWGAHIEKGYTYVAMAFAVIVEVLNMRLRTKAKPVQLHEPEYKSPDESV